MRGRTTVCLSPGPPAGGWTPADGSDANRWGTEHYRLVVVIPAYNAEATLGEQLAALCRQTCDVSWQICGRRQRLDRRHPSRSAVAYSSPRGASQRGSGSGAVAARPTRAMLALQRHRARGSPFVTPTMWSAAGWLSCDQPSAVTSTTFVSGGVELEQCSTRVGARRRAA